MPHGSSAAPRALTDRSKATAIGVLFIIGGLGGILAATSTQPREVINLLPAWALTVLAVLIGMFLLWRGHQIPRWGMHVVLLCATVMVGIGVMFSAGESAAMAVAGLFALCSVGVVHYFTGLPARLHYGLQLAGLAFGLGLQGLPLGVIAAMGVTHLFISATIAFLFARASRSMIDSLTGLPNRRSFDENLAFEVLEAQRSEGIFSIAMMDVDHFKEVNDREGHAAGDLLLQRLAREWAKHLPHSVRLCRHGGDEFGLLAPGYSIEQLHRLSEQLRMLAAPSSISVGVAGLGQREEPASLTRRADAALYAAKAAGRSCTRSAQPDDDALRADLTDAISSGMVNVHLQRIVRPLDASTMGVEALARWSHPVRGSVPPSQFIPLAERTGQVIPLGRLILEKACRDATRLAAATPGGLMLTVNASGKELIQPTYVDEVADVLMRTGWPVTQLIIEVTESTVQIASPSALANLQRLRELGAKIAIDDFGTGYSAFSHLDTLPADYLKLDAAFTADITTSARRRAMLVALLDLCARLGLTVIAEGVESAEHAALLNSLNCPLAQGYYYSAPGSLDSLLGDLIPPPVGLMAHAAASPSTDLEPCEEESDD